MQTDYIPAKDADKVIWLLNIEGKIDTFLAQLGITAADSTAIKLSCSNIRAAITASEAARTASKQAVANKKAITKAEQAKLRNAIQTWKLKSTYTEAIGEALNLNGGGADFETEAVYKAQITATVLPGRVVINFIKNGADGVNVYVRLVGEANFTKLAFDSYSPYEDNRPLAVAGTPENREYMAIGVMDDEEYGSESDIVQVTFGG